MTFNAETRNQDGTFTKVTLELDPDTCFLLAEVFAELGAALTDAQRRHKARQRFQAASPMRQARQNELRGRVARRMMELASLPLPKLIKTMRPEFKESWDGMEYLVRDIRREERKAELERRNALLLELSRAGRTPSEIAKALKLSSGTVKNILSRLNKASPLPAGAKATAA